MIDPRRGDVLPAPNDIAGAVIAGSNAMVTDRAAWSEALSFWLAELVAQSTPILGICYGHQLLAHALGGEVGYHPKSFEIGIVGVCRTNSAKADILFKEIPAQFPVQVIHRQSVLRLPKEAVLLAGNDFEPHHAFRVGENAWGIQFHPEFSSDVMRSYIDPLAADLQKNGADVDKMAATVASTDAAAGMLKTFAAIVLSREIRAWQR